MPQERRQNERLLALAAMLFVFLNYPLLSLFSRDSFLFGIPVLYLYLFCLWAVAIAVMLLVQSRRRLPSSVGEKGGQT